MRLVFALDALPALRHATGADIDVAAAATLAELAGADAVRLGIDDALKPVSEHDVSEVRRSARDFELRMPANPGLVKIALEARPDLVLLAAGAREGLDGSSLVGTAGRALDLGSGSGGRKGGNRNPLAPVMRPLAEAGIETWLRIAPRLDAVKAAHGEGAAGVEIFTGGIVDLPRSERETELEALRDAVRLASKLHMSIGLGGGLGYRTVPQVLEGAPAVGGVAVGRELVSRAILVGLDRALRDLKKLIA
ncbi:MAG: pyridoxine 5'-phosphate synthase [Myxococcota bacterium]